MPVSLSQEREVPRGSVACHGVPLLDAVFPSPFSVEVFPGQVCMLFKIEVLLFKTNF